MALSKLPPELRIEIWEHVYRDEQVDVYGYFHIRPCFDRDRRKGVSTLLSTMFKEFREEIEFALWGNTIFNFEGPLRLGYFLSRQPVLVDSTKLQHAVVQMSCSIIPCREHIKGQEDIWDLFELPFDYGPLQTLKLDITLDCVPGCSHCYDDYDPMPNMLLIQVLEKTMERLPRLRTRCLTLTSDAHKIAHTSEKVTITVTYDEYFKEISKSISNIM